MGLIFSQASSSGEAPEAGRGEIGRMRQKSNKITRPETERVFMTNTSVRAGSDLHI